MRQPASQEGLRGGANSPDNDHCQGQKKFFRFTKGPEKFFLQVAPEGPAWTMLAAGQVVDQA